MAIYLINSTNSETLFTIFYATLHNYQNVFIQKKEPKVNPIPINHDIKVYELK